MTVQAQILEIMRDLKTELKTAIVLISHDMGVIAGIADRVQVMRDGEVVERGRSTTSSTRRAHDYTKMLLDAMPRLDRPTPGIATDAAATILLDVEDVKVAFPVSGDGLFAADAAAARRRRRVASRCAQARRWASSAKAAAANPPWRARCCKLLPDRRRPVVWLGRDLGQRSAGEIRRAAQGFPDRLPGPAGQPRSAHDHRRVHRRAAARARAGPVARRGARTRARR